MLPLAEALARLRRAGPPLPDLRQPRHASSPAPSAATPSATRGCSASWPSSRICGRWSGPAGSSRGRYHVLGGTLKALDGIGPEELGVDRLLRRVAGAGHRRGDPGAGRHRRRPDHQPLPGRAPAAAGLHRHPARPWRAGRRRAHLSRRGHAGRRACAPASGSLDRPAPSPYLTAAFHARNELYAHGPARDPAGPASRAEGQGQAGRRGSTTRCAGSPPTCSRPCTRPPASGSRHRRSASRSG